MCFPPLFWFWSDGNLALFSCPRPQTALPFPAHCSLSNLYTVLSTWGGILQSHISENGLSTHQFREVFSYIFVQASCLNLKILE